MEERGYKLFAQEMRQPEAKILLTGDLLTGVVLHVVMVADLVDLPDKRIGGGSACALRCDRLIPMGGGCPTNLRGAAIIQVLEAPGGGQSLLRARGGKTSCCIRRATSEKTNDKTGKSQGSYFEKAAGGAGRLAGGHGVSPLAKNVFKMQGFRVFQWMKVNFDGSRKAMTCWWQNITKGLAKELSCRGFKSLCISIAAVNIRYIDSK
jgi:hypothetical protein